MGYNNLKYLYDFQTNVIPNTNQTTAIVPFTKEMRLNGRDKRRRNRFERDQIKIQNLEQQCQILENTIQILNKQVMDLGRENYVNSKCFQWYQRMYDNLIQRLESQNCTKQEHALTCPILKSRKENPQKPTQLSSRSHPRHLVGKRTAQKTPS